MVPVGAPRVATGLLAAAPNAPVVTSEGALLVNVPQRFLSPQIRTILAGQMRERKASKQILGAFTSTLGSLSSPLRNPPPHFRLLQTQREAPPLPPRSKCLALQRLEEIVAAIKPASAVSKLHQSCHCGVSRTGELMQAEKSAETFLMTSVFTATFRRVAEYLRWNRQLRLLKPTTQSASRTSQLQR